MKGTPLVLISWLTAQKPDKVFEVAEYREKKKRSLQANNYMWELINKIADSQSPPLSKDDVYLDMIHHYAPSEWITVNSEVDVKGYLKYFEKKAEVELQGKSFTHYIAWKGSSEFSPQEMSKFLDAIIQECHQLDIETITPAEKERMIREYEAQHMEFKSYAD